jgi:hypothetical protein
MYRCIECLETRCNDSCIFTNTKHDSSYEGFGVPTLSSPYYSMLNYITIEEYAMLREELKPCFIRLKDPGDDFFYVWFTALIRDHVKQKFSFEP